jgi:hypothetical protein
MKTPLAQFTTTTKDVSTTKTAQTQHNRKHIIAMKKQRTTNNLITKIPQYVAPSSELYLNMTN